MSIRIKSPLPKGDRNGLLWLTDDIYEKREPVMAVVELLPYQVIDKVQSEDDPKGLVLMVAGVEALTDMDAEAAKALLDSAYERRTGKTALPFGTVLDVNPEELDEPPVEQWEWDQRSGPEDVPPAEPEPER